MPKRSTRRYESTLLFLVGVAVGFVLLMICSKLFQLEMNSTLSIQIDPLNVASLCVTAILALFIIKQLRNQSGVSRSKVEMLNRYFNEFREDVRNFVGSVAFKRSGKPEELADRMKVLRTHLISLFRLARTEKLVQDGSPAVAGLGAAIDEIGGLLTDQSLEKGAKGKEKAIRVEDGMFQYSQSRLGLIAGKTYELDSWVFELALELARGAESAGDSGS